MGVPWAPPGRPLKQKASPGRPLGVSRAPQGTPREAPRAPLGDPWGIPGSPWGSLGIPWESLGCPLGVSSVSPGCLLVPPSPVWGHGCLQPSSRMKRIIQSKRSQKNSIEIVVFLNRNGLPNGTLIWKNLIKTSVE